MKIKVLQTTKASKDISGTQIFEYKQNEVYEIYQELAEVFLKEGWGIEAKENQVEEKAIEELENKAIDNLENKTFAPKKGRKSKNDE